MSLWFLSTAVFDAPPPLKLFWFTGFVHSGSESGHDILLVSQNLGITAKSYALPVELATFKLLFLDLTLSLPPQEGTATWGVRSTCHLVHVLSHEELPEVFMHVNGLLVSARLLGANGQSRSTTPKKAQEEWTCSPSVLGTGWK